MLFERSMSRNWLSNTYLVADEPGGHAVLIDTGGPAEPILRKIEDWRLTVTHALCTHHHADHVLNSDLYRSRLGCRICGHVKERRLFGDLDAGLSDGDEIRSGGLRLRCLHVPGHTIGQLAYVLNEAAVFTGDTLFKGSVGGTRAAGHATFRELKRSIMEVLLRLPPEMAVHPGHSDPTTIGQEWEENPFVRIWRGLDAPGGGRCMALGAPATLILRARDYDGGSKCWVRLEDGGVDEIVPGSAVRDLPA